MLCLAAADAGWVHTDTSGRVVPLLLDGRVQDASLELDYHFHVNEMFSGLSHQYHGGVLKSSEDLCLNDVVALGFQQRLDPLTRVLTAAEQASPRLVRQLRHAIGWVSRSRRSTSDSERFICLWVAAEYLLVSCAPDASVAKDAVSAGVSRVMSRGDRTARRFWRGIAEEAYDLRNDLVHEAAEDADRLRRMTPLLQQAVFEVIWTAALAADGAGRDGHPAEFLPR